MSELTFVPHYTFARRQVLLTVCAQASLLVVPSVVHAQPVSVAVATMTALKFPGPIIATCDNLKDTVDAMTAELATVKSNPAAMGKQVMDRVMKYRDALDKATKDANQNIKNAKFEFAFKAVGTALSLVMIALGYAFPGTLAVGLLAATTVVIGVAAFGFQAYHYQKNLTPSMVLVYTKDRTIMLGQIGVQNALKPGAQLLSNCLSGVLLLISMTDVYGATKNEARAKKDLATAVVLLNGINKEIDLVGVTPEAWAEVYRMNVEAAKAALQKYIEATAATDCKIPNGPMLTKG